MKHLKIFENFEIEYKYKIGDYIRLKNDKNEWRVYTIAKILNLKSDTAFCESNNIEPDYFVETFYTHYLMKGQITKFWVNESEIEDNASPEEIEDYELKIAIKKYNL